MDDKRGELQTEIIDIFVLSTELPNSWSSIATLRNNFYEDKLGNTQTSVEKYLEENEEQIKNKMIMIRKIISNLKYNKFFIFDKKLFKKYYVPYKCIISVYFINFK